MTRPVFLVYLVSVSHISIIEPKKPERPEKQDRRPLTDAQSLIADGEDVWRER